MKKILFIYSIVVIIGISFHFAFSNPTKTNLIASFLLVPIPAYLFLLITDPKNTAVPKWSLRVIFVILTSAVFIYLLISFLNPLINKSNNNNSETFRKNTEEIIKNEVAPTAQPASNSSEFTDILMEEAKND